MRTLAKLFDLVRETLNLHDQPETQLGFRPVCNSTDAHSDSVVLTQIGHGWKLSCIYLAI
jgi:hypothetical protein